MSDCRFCGVDGLTWIETLSGWRLAVRKAKDKDLEVIYGSREPSPEWLAVHGNPKVFKVAATGDPWISHSCGESLQAWKYRAASR